MPPILQETLHAFSSDTSLDKDSRLLILNKVHAVPAFKFLSNRTLIAIPLAVIRSVLVRPIPIYPSAIKFPPDMTEDRPAIPKLLRRIEVQKGSSESDVTGLKNADIVALRSFMSLLRSHIDAYRADLTPNSYIQDQKPSIHTLQSWLSGTPRSPSLPVQNIYGHPYFRKLPRTDSND